nr:hypothetical protein [Tanacetum cinerariifolium]
MAARDVKTPPMVWFSRRGVGIFIDASSHQPPKKLMTPDIGVAKSLINIIVLLSKLYEDTDVGLVQLGDVNKVLSIFNQMRVEGIQPDSLTVIGISHSTTRKESVRLLKSIHSFGIEIGVQVDVLISDTWVSSYDKVRDLDSAYSKAIGFYKKMLYDGFRPDLSTNINLLSSISQHEALFAGKLIHCHGIKMGYDLDTKCDDLNAARLVFDSMMDRTYVTWTAMIGGYAEKGDLDKALTFFDSLEATGLKPDLVTLLNLIAGCGKTGALKIRRWVEKYAVSNELKINLMVLNSLIDILDHYSSMAYLLARGGKINDTLEFIRKMPIKPDVRIWSSLLSACKIHHNVEIGEFAAYNLFEMDPRAAAPYVEMANIYASEGR